MAIARTATARKAAMIPSQKTMTNPGALPAEGRYDQGAHGMILRAPLRLATRRIAWISHAGILCGVGQGGRPQLARVMHRIQGVGNRHSRHGWLPALKN